MKLLSLLLLCLASMACNKDCYIYYKYNDVTITRIDKKGESRFYSGYYDNEQKLPSSYIIGRYPNGDNVMEGYLVFDKGNSVRLIMTVGYFDKVGSDSQLSLRDYNNNEFWKWFDTVKGSFKNVAWISDATESEKERNQDNHSKVLATYPN